MSETTLMVYNAFSIRCGEWTSVMLFSLCKGGSK